MEVSNSVLEGFIFWRSRTFQNVRLAEFYVERNDSLRVTTVDIFVAVNSGLVWTRQSAAI